MIPFYRARLSSGKITAVDYSSKMIEIARSKHPENGCPAVEYVVSDLYDLEYDGEYDLAVCYSCFPHFVDKEGALRKLRSCVRAGGRVVIAHSSSADCINNVHRERGEEISLDILPRMSELTLMMHDVGLDAVFTRDDDEFYICISERRG
ncbi:MAG: class I SAM-dependent methyltransferase [Euryarchaeota archaeon]|nr:class I SAM-dependent methyltransferase [Euryarchaeota archaeon]